MPDTRTNGELALTLGSKEIYIRGVWVSKGDGKHNFYLNDTKYDTPISVFGVPMYVTAVEIKEGDRQRAKNPLNEIILQDLGRISPHGNPFETCLINGEECVLYMIPYTR